MQNLTGIETAWPDPAKFDNCHELAENSEPLTMLASLEKVSGFLAQTVQLSLVSRVRGGTTNELRRWTYTSYMA